MDNLERRKIGIFCEVCGENPATELKGGIYNGKRNMWMVCKSCKDKIDDTRKRRE